MYIFSRKEIQIKEYDKKTVLTKHSGLLEINEYSPLTIKGVQLSMAIARTTCNEYINYPELYFDAIQSLLGLQFLINKKNNNLKLNEGRVKRLRDFSRTSKIGELAQAITWLYLEEKSNFPFSIDFELFCKNNSVKIPAKSKTPDFIAQDTTRSTNICIVESKGKLANSTRSLKTKLKDGLDQCEVGETLINANGVYKVVKKLSFCTELFLDNNVGDTTLHFVDPERSIEKSEFNSYIFRAHYASWFYIAGQFKNADQLIKGEHIEFAKTEFEEREINGEVYWIKSLNNIIFNVLSENHFAKYYFCSIPFYKLEIGIANRIVEALQSQNITEFDFSRRESSEETIFFRDGTIIMNKREKIM